ncbi:unnamed protein product [Coregonus sp. 'balchen']|nr:unnamed protein product [Coregonus sp. 'balchen']
MFLRSLANKASDPREDQQSMMQQPEASVRQEEERIKVIKTVKQILNGEFCSHQSTCQACAQVSYAEKEASVIKQKAELEASLLKQKADLDASLYVLQVERAAAAALAEAAAFEEAVVRMQRAPQRTQHRDTALKSSQTYL